MASRSQSIETALGAAFGGEEVSVIYATDAEYWVMLELTPNISTTSTILASSIFRPAASMARPARAVSCPIPADHRLDWHGHHQPGGAADRGHDA